MAQDLDSLTRDQRAEFAGQHAIVDKHCGTEVHIAMPDAKTSDGKDVQIQWVELTYICPDCNGIIFPEAL